MSYESAWDHEYEQDCRDREDTRQLIENNREEEWWAHQNEKIQTVGQFWDDLRESVSKVVR